MIRTDHSTMLSDHKPEMDSPGTEAEELPQSFIEVSIQYLRARCAHRLSSHFGRLDGPFRQGAPVPLENDNSPLAVFIRSCPISADEFTVLLLALVPHLLPGFFEGLIQEVLPSGGELPEFGGIKGNQHRSMLPTGETALFIVAGTNVNDRVQAMHIFDPQGFLVFHKMVSIGEVSNGEPAWSGRLLLDQEFAEVFTTGKVELPKLSARFPAEHITTEMQWDDLVLSEQGWQQIRELEHWVMHHRTLMQDWAMHRHLSPGYRILFYGPPGTGKTLTATLLGKQTNTQVFRIDLSKVVSKFIGETEKNLARLFDKAEHKDWILFFDECDAIFSKRTGVRDAHDKYANQEVSYLLQRIESYNGLVILASNFKNNIDQAFVRRINAILYFPAPDYDQKLALWNQAFPEKASLDKSVSFETLAANYDLTGAQIMNVVQYVCLQSIAEEEREILAKHIEKGIRREMAKEGK